ncbi:MAG TPA: T9SS type A sorting domain-containing protein [Saprospiraceae bacterium]|nr:T9SS type A sorting domain-containing protein [Saprospiraceae bacterium]
MKTRNSIYLLCILFLATQARAQVIYERTYAYASNSIKIPVELSDTSTFSFDNEDVCGGIGVRHIDKFGNEATNNWFRAEGFSSGYYWIGHDSILIWVVHGAWDVGVDSFRVYVWTPDTTRRIVSKYMASDARDVIGGAFLYTSNRLLYRQGDTLFTLNLVNGIEEDSLIVPDLDTIMEFEKSILVVSSTSYPVLLNDKLEVIGIWPDLSFLPFNVNEALVLDSFLLGIDVLHPLEISTFNIYSEDQMSIDLTGYFDQIDEIQSNKNNLFIKGRSAGEDMILQLDSTFNFIDIQPFEIPDLDKEMNFRYYPDRVYAWSTDGMAKYEANYRICFPYIDPSPIQYVDIALDTIWVDSFSVPHPHDDIVSIYLKAVVTNRSNDTVHSYTLHHEEPFDHFCFDGVYLYQYDQQFIEPNGSDTIRFQLWTYNTLHFQRRVYVHHANHHLDTLLFNNSFLVNHLLSSSDELTGKQIVLYPNPFTDYITVSEPSASMQLILFDQTGRLVESGYEQLEDLGNLPPGIYFLQISTGNATSIQKVVKVE